MVEVVGLVASVVQLAGTGIKLSISLYTFAETVASADKSITHIAKDISLTSAVLTQLGDNLKDDRYIGVASDNAIKTADEVVHECSQVFSEINAALAKATGKGKGKLSLSNFKWPFLQPKMELLRSNLDRLKSTLTLMLNVLTYAKSKKRHAVKASEANLQKDQIHALIEANKRAVAGFEQMRLTAATSSYYNQDAGHEGSSSTFRSPDSGSFAQDKGISMNSFSNTKAFPPERRGSLAAKSPDSGILVVSDTTKSLSPKEYVQLMSSMDANALIQWLQKHCSIVDDTRNARTIITATDVWRGQSLNDSCRDRDRQQRYVQDADGFLIPVATSAADVPNPQRPYRNRTRHASEHHNRQKYYMQDANGLLVPAVPSEAGVRPLPIAAAGLGQGAIIINNHWDDSSPDRDLGRRRSHHGRHYSSDEEDDRAHSFERDRARSRGRGRRRRHSSRESSPLDPEVEKRMQRLADLERKDEHSIVRQRYQEEMILLEARRRKESDRKQEKGAKHYGKKIVDLTRPTYTKIHRKYISPDTLEIYEMPWEWDDLNPDYILIKRWIPEDDQDILFEHTRKLREGRLLSNAPVELKKKENDSMLLVRRKASRPPRRAREYLFDDDDEDSADEVEKLLGEWTTLEPDTKSKSDRKPRSRDRQRSYVLT